MKPIPLSDPQRLIWLNEQLYAGTSLHVIAAGAVFAEALDEALLRDALRRYVTESDALRTVLVMGGGEPRQTFDEGHEAVVTTIDLRGEPDARAAMRRLGAERAAVPLPLDGPRLYEILIARLAGGRTGLLLKAHHLVCDAYSVFLFLTGVARNYRRLTGAEPASEVPTPRYAEHVDVAEAHSDRHDHHRRFWAEQLAPLDEGTLFGDRDLLSTSTRGERVSLTWPRELVRGLRAQGRVASVSTYGQLVGILGSVLARSLGREHVCIGSPFVNRPGARALRTFGMFVNTMPIVVSGAHESVGAYVERAARNAARCVRNGYLPYREMRRASALANASGALFDVGLSYQQADFSRVALPMEHLEWFFPGHEMNALTFHVHDRLGDDELSFDADYRTAILTESQVRTAFDAMTAAAEDVVSSSDAPWRTRPLLARAEPEPRPLPEPALARPGFVTDWIAESARRHPDRVAVTDGRRSCTYAELELRARACARRLGALGVLPGAPVLVLASRSLDTVTAIVGVLYAGAHYVPLAPGAPPRKLEQVARRSGASILLAPDAEIGEVPAHVRRVSLAGACEPLSADDAARRTVPEDAPSVEADTPCYVLFTSGSTGEPKGVVVDHGGLRHYVDFAVRAYGDGDPLTMPLFTSLGFDLTVTSLFGPLVTGGTLHVYPDALDDTGETLERVFTDDRCDVVKLTPSHLRVLERLDAVGSRLRLLVVGGESLASELVQRVAARLGPRVRIVNEYGPTEAVVGCVVHTWSAADDRYPYVPIGRPLPGTSVRVTTPWHAPQLPGFAGELEVGGPALAQGYLGAPTETALRFVSDAHGRWYRTGDLVRDEEGTFHCLGRRDRQVKQNGYRIELGELEVALLAHADVSAAYALHASAKNQLAVFWLGRDVPTQELERHLRERVPSYAMPSALLHCADLPLTRHGKVDEAALLALLDDAVPAGGDDAPGLDGASARVLATVAALLGREPADVAGRSFAAAGGDSVNAIHVVSRLRSLGVQARVNDLLAAPSLARFAAAVGELAGASDREATADEGPLDTPLPMQRWFLDARFDDEHHYHQSVLFETPTPLEPSAVREALRRVVDIHDALRLVVDAERRLAFDDAPREAAAWFDEVTIPGEEDEDDVVRRVCSHAKAAFDLAGAPLLRGVLFRRAAGGGLLFLCAHHLAVDVASWFTIVDDFWAVYEEPARRLRRPPTSVRQWAQALVAQPLNDAAERHWASVEEAIANAPKPTPRAERDRAWATEELVIEPSTGHAGSFYDPAVHEAFGTHPHELLLAALVGVTAASLGLGKLHVEVESHGRADGPPNVDVTRTVGWLTLQAPLVVDVDDSRDLERLVVGVKDGLRRMPDAGRGWHRHARRRARPVLVYNFLGSVGRFAHPELRLSEKSTGPDRSPAQAPLEAVEAVVERRGDATRFRLTFDGRYFGPDERAAFRQELERRCLAMLAFCAGRAGRVLTASDFPTLALTADDLSGLFDE